MNKDSNDKDEMVVEVLNIMAEEGIEEANNILADIEKLIAGRSRVVRITVALGLAFGVVDDHFTKNSFMWLLKNDVLLNAPRDDD